MFNDLIAKNLFDLYKKLRSRTELPVALLLLFVLEGIE